jgi:hypothetical protein
MKAKLSRLFAMTILLITFLAVSGCNLFNRSEPVYVAAGQIAEIARPSKVQCWITNKETGKRELRTIEAQAGWYIGRLKVEGD